MKKILYIGITALSLSLVMPMVAWAEEIIETVSITAQIETMKEAVKRTAGRAETECSGNVTKSRLKEIAAIGVDYVSCGTLTHSAPILDFSLKNLSPIE